MEMIVFEHMMNEILRKEGVRLLLCQDKSHELEKEKLIRMDKVSEKSIRWFE